MSLSIAISAFALAVVALARLLGLQRVALRRLVGRARGDSRARLRFRDAELRWCFAGDGDYFVTRREIIARGRALAAGARQ